MTRSIFLGALLETRRLLFQFFSATPLILLPSFSLSASLFPRQADLSCAQGNSLSNWGSGRKLRLGGNLIERKWTRKERCSVPWRSYIEQKEVCRRRTGAPQHLYRHCLIIIIWQMSWPPPLMKLDTSTDVATAHRVKSRWLGRLHLSARTGGLTWLYYIRVIIEIFRRNGRGSRRKLHSEELHNL